MPTFVLDMNFLQSEDLKERLQSEPDTHYVLPDVAFVEMCKHVNWQLTMKLATSTLYKYPERVKVSLSLGEALTIELNRLTPLHRQDILSEAFTETVTQLINLLHVDAELEERMTEARAALLKGELDADDAKNRTRTYLGLLNKGLEPALIKALRAPELDRGRLVAFAYGLAHAYSWHMLTKDRGMSDDDALDYLEVRPLLFRYQFLVVRHCLVHMRNGTNLKSYKASKELNNQLDLDFALTASYFDGLLSKDSNLVESYLDLKSAIDIPRPELTNLANAWFEELGLINE
jgi:hypothetical protein